MEKLTAMAKLEYKLANVKNKLDLLYRNLGKVKFGEMAGDEVEESAYRELFDDIAQKLITIEQMEEELAKLRNYRFCVACGSKINNDMAFCPKCGTRQQPMEDEEVAVEDAPEAEASEEETKE